MKRSHAVVAVLSAAMVGTTAYSMMAPEHCASAVGGATANPPGASCTSGSGGSGGGHGSRTIWGSSGHTTAPAATTARGGFGSTAHAIGGHGGS